MNLLSVNMIAMWMFEVLVESLQSTALGNIILLVAAFVGVAGNYWLYLRKQDRRRVNLRQALYAEMSSMKPVVRAIDKEHDVITMDPIDPRSFVVDYIYRSSSDELGLLSEEEVAAIVDFYSTAISIQDLVGDEYHVVYEQVSRRDLAKKLDSALVELESSGDLKIYQDLGLDKAEIPTEPPRV
ncbi:hypothetical protein [Haloferax sp. DFSO60]|uniref:hypothetical protein n=1 Tax=Haloferax sp. DFSO60 TaxID=3388652 RepID=UPI00397966A0